MACFAADCRGATTEIWDRFYIDCLFAYRFLTEGKYRKKKAFRDCQLSFISIETCNERQAYIASRVMVTKVPRAVMILSEFDC